MTGFHSVMESPDSVSRVMPPTTTIATTSAATQKSQRAIDSAPGWPGNVPGKEEREGMAASMRFPQGHCKRKEGDGICRWFGNDIL